MTKNGTNVVTVTKVLLEEDLRAVHKLRRRVRCRRGECWVFVNRRSTMARIVDSSRSVHCYWAPKNELIDTQTLKEMTGSLRITLRVTPAHTAEIDKRSERKVLRAA